MAEPGVGWTVWTLLVSCMSGLTRGAELVTPQVAAVELVPLALPLRLAVEAAQPDEGLVVVQGDELAEHLQAELALGR
jgi:hypothetical protein